MQLENSSVHVISWATNLFSLKEVSQTMVTIHVRRNGEHVALDNLDPPLQFFLHVNERLGAFDRRCVFWDTVPGNWSGGGLQVARRNLTQVGSVVLNDPVLAVSFFEPCLLMDSLPECRYRMNKVSLFHVLMALLRLVCCGCNSV